MLFAPLRLSLVVVQPRGNVLASDANNNKGITRTSRAEVLNNHQDTGFG